MLLVSAHFFSLVLCCLFIYFSLCLPCLWLRAHISLETISDANTNKKGGEPLSERLGLVEFSSVPTLIRFKNGHKGRTGGKWGRRIKRHQDAGQEDLEGGVKDGWDLGST